jgi:hypothetical protein
MAQQAVIRGNSDEVASLQDDHELKYWSDILGVEPDVLEKAVRAVGAEATTMHEYLKQRRASA